MRCDTIRYKVLCQGFGGVIFAVCHGFLEGLDSRCILDAMMDSCRVATCGVILSTFILSDMISTKRKAVQLFELAYSLVYAVLYARTIVDSSAQP